MDRKVSEKTAEDKVFIVTLIFTGVDNDALERYLKTAFKDLIPESIEVEEFGNPPQVTVIVPERLPDPGEASKLLQSRKTPQLARVRLKLGMNLTHR